MLLLRRRRLKGDDANDARRVHAFVVGGSVKRLAVDSNCNTFVFVGRATHIASDITSARCRQF